MNKGFPRMFLSHWFAAAMHETANRNLYYGLYPMLS